VAVPYIIADCGLLIADLNNIADCGLSIADLKSEITNPKSEMTITGLLYTRFFIRFGYG
jgi:hypothetical protein